MCYNSNYHLDWDVKGQSAVNSLRYCIPLCKICEKSSAAEIVSLLAHFQNGANNTVHKIHTVHKG